MSPYWHEDTAPTTEAEHGLLCAENAVGVARASAISGSKGESELGGRGQGVSAEVLTEGRSKCQSVTVCSQWSLYCSLPAVARSPLTSTRYRCSRLTRLRSPLP